MEYSIAGEHVSEDNYVQAGGGLQTRKREATVIPGKPQTITGRDKSAQGIKSISGSFYSHFPKCTM